MNRVFRSPPSMTRWCAFGVGFRFRLLSCTILAAGCCHFAIQASPGVISKRTLVLYASARAVYGLGHELEFLKLQLQRVDTRLEAAPVAELEATPGRLDEASHLVVFCPEPGLVLSSNLLAKLAEVRKPVLWVGHGVADPALTHSLLGPLEPAPGAIRTLSQVVYRGSKWGVDLAEWIPVNQRLTPGTIPDHRALMTIPNGDGQKEDLALCWQHGAVTVFSAVPRPGLLGFLFADVLLDFFQVTNTPPSQIVLRIDDYQAGSDHFEFQTKVDLLAARGVPFFVSVAPSWRTSPTGAVVTLDSAPAFVESLREAQARGGRLLVRGCVREPGDSPEFWNSETDRPVALSPEQVRQQLQQAVGLMLKHGLLPVGWQTPGDAASRQVYQEIAQVFSTAVERPQLSDLTGRETALLSAQVRDREGRDLIPENLGFVPAAGSSTNGLSTLRRRAAVLTRLRGTLAGAYFHAYLPQEQLTELLNTLETLKKPFMDALSLDHWVHVPGRLLLTGGAEQKVRLAGGVVQWRAFNRAGQQVQSEQEFVLPGERVLRRKGRGAYELYEYTEGGRP